MVYINNFGVIGGDNRQAAMAQAFAEDGYTVFAAGLDKAELSASVKKMPLQDVVQQSDCLILPLPVTADGKTLNAPFSSFPIVLDDRFAQLLADKRVFCGMASRLIKTSELWNRAQIYDYGNREEFAVRNAVPTAEGAIEIAMREYPGTINGANILVTGFGRIGKVLCAMLKGLGATVTVSARKQKDFAWIELCGCRAIPTGELKNAAEKDVRGYDIIFNTIPAVIFDAHVLAKVAGHALLVDLASAPGGVDFEAAQRLHIKAIQALSLPGKVAPKAAGEIIKSTVYHMIEEI